MVLLASVLAAARSPASTARRWRISVTPSQMPVATPKVSVSVFTPVAAWAVKSASDTW